MYLIFHSTSVFSAGLPREYTNISLFLTMTLALTNLSLNWFQLLKCRQYKDRCLSHTRLGLTDDVHAQDCLWDALVLHCVTDRRTDRQTMYTLHIYTWRQNCQYLFSKQGWKKP